MADVKADYDALRDPARDQARPPDCSTSRRPGPTRRRSTGSGYVPPLPGRSPASTCSTDYDIAELRDYIDWQPFFNAWEMKGKFPDILNNPADG